MYLSLFSGCNFLFFLLYFDWMAYFWCRFFGRRGGIHVGMTFFGWWTFEFTRFNKVDVGSDNLNVDVGIFLKKVRENKFEKFSAKKNLKNIYLISLNKLRCTTESLKTMSNVSNTILNVIKFQGGKILAKNVFMAHCRPRNNWQLSIVICSVE